MYGDNTIVDSDQVEQFQHTETAGGVSVTATFTPPVAARPTNGLRDLINAARRQQAHSQPAIAEQPNQADLEPIASESAPS